MIRKRSISVFVVMSLAACTPAAPDTVEIVRPVYAHRVAAGGENIARTFSGIVGVAGGVDLGFDVSGRIIELKARTGQTYQQGAVLARMDASDYRADANNAEAQFAVAEADLNRTLRLFESNTASKSQLDADMARREAAKASLAIARKRLRDCALIMPYAGVIGRVVADSQQVVSPGQTVVTIQNQEGFEIEFGVPVDIIDLIAMGQEIRIKLGAYPDREYAGIVQEIAPQISDNTTYPITARFEGEAAGIKEGMDGEVSIQLPNPNGVAIVVPAVAIAGSPSGGAYAWIVEGTGELATVTKREVSVGPLRRNGTLEVSAGLAVGELIVSRGVHRVHDGQTVRVLSATPAEF